ncbi:MAG: DUF2461 domain-containing protein [Bacteroidota bacterium]
MARSISRVPSRSPLDEGIDLDFPPFPGFDKKAFTFLKELKANNSREWFTPEKKEIYQAHLVEPMRTLLAELGSRFRDEGLPFSPDPKRSMFRIYRDTRFSKDKTPFKTNIGAAVPFASEGKEGIGNYIHIDPVACFYGGGAYFMESASLARLRAAIDRDPAALRKILVKAEKDFGTLQGAKLKRGPVGYAKDHPAMDLLVYTQMWISKGFPAKLAGSRELVDWIVIKTHESADFNRYLYDAMRGDGLPDC